MKKDVVRDVRHVKAARELMRWNQARLAEEAGLSIASVRRYEAARDEIAASIERDIIDALERVGIVFVADKRIGAIQYAVGVLMKTSAVPDAPSQKAVYIYEEAAGRPAGRKEAAPRKGRRRKEAAEA